MCLLILGVIFPRVVLVLLFLLTNTLPRAYHGMLIPVLGFFFLPLTTLVYAWIVNMGEHVQGLYLVAIVICVLVDLGLIGQSARGARK
jgi:hypothetical protein